MLWVSRQSVEQLCHTLTTSKPTTIIIGSGKLHSAQPQCFSKVLYDSLSRSSLSLVMLHLSIVAPDGPVFCNQSYTVSCLRCSSKGLLLYSMGVLTFIWDTGCFSPWTSPVTVPRDVFSTCPTTPSFFAFSIVLALKNTPCTCSVRTSEEGPTCRLDQSLSLNRKGSDWAISPCPSPQNQRHCKSSRLQAS